MVFLEEITVALQNYEDVRCIHSLMHTSMILSPRQDRVYHRVWLWFRTCRCESTLKSWILSNIWLLWYQQQWRERVEKNEKSNSGAPRHFRRQKCKYMRRNNHRYLQTWRLVFHIHIRLHIRVFNQWGDLLKGSWLVGNTLKLMYLIR